MMAGSWKTGWYETGSRLGVGEFDIVSTHTLPSGGLGSSGVAPGYKTSINNNSSSKLLGVWAVDFKFSQVINT